MFSDKLAILGCLWAEDVASGKVQGASSCNGHQVLLVAWRSRMLTVVLVIRPRCSGQAAARWDWAGLGTSTLHVAMTACTGRVCLWTLGPRCPLTWCWGWVLARTHPRPLQAVLCLVLPSQRRLKSPLSSTGGELTRNQCRGEAELACCP